ncbi:MAG: putative porin [Mediterranea sp.]|nr:putative porin [Mediterranea sp.]
MRRIQLLFILLLFCRLGTIAQNTSSLDGFERLGDQQIDPAMRIGMQDSSNVEIISLVAKMYMWKISEELGNIIPIPVDTTFHLFQNTNLMEGMRGRYNHLGNLGSPRLSRIFFDRPSGSSSLFLDPFSIFFTQPWDHHFVNSNIPYTNLTYHTNFDKQDGEERFKAYFSVNANKNLAFGFNFDYLYGRGYYQNQSTSFMKGGLFGSYTGDRYKAHFIYNMFNMKMQENGGITDDRYITAPEEMSEGRKEYRTTEIPTNLTRTWNYNKNFYVHYTHRYNLGFNKDIPDPKKEGDTIESFIPVTSFIHTVRVERSRHKFISEDKEYQGALDTTTYVGVKNTFGIALLEGFNKYAKAGLTAYISHKHSQYTLMNSTDGSGNAKYKESEVFVGGELSKREGNLLHYRVLGEVGMAGQAGGQFRVNGDMDLNFRLFNDTVNLIARSSITNTLPAFYMRHYHSTYFQWDNEGMDKEFRSRVEGELNIGRWGTNLKAGVENIKNYTYFNGTANPAQSGGNIQVLSATLSQNFKAGILHWDNEVTWQKSSKEEILPLPDLSIYSNLYLDTKLAKKVLSLQLGADVRYFTKYKAPTYTPAIQQFHLQGEDQMDIGGFPIVNIYANFHLKRTRFFVMMSHVNSGMGDLNYFMVPHYPVNQSLLRFGLSWNFFD